MPLTGRAASKLHPPSGCRSRGRASSGRRTAATSPYYGGWLETWGADLADARGEDHLGAGLRLSAWRRVPAPGAWTVQDRLAVPSLSEREQQVAELAAGGLSSREIAERLVVSQRTVDNHLSAVYRKLGLEGRTQLRELLAAPGGARLPRRDG